ncbi:MAG: molybdenum cofactor carrier protein [Alphaproteobacteria bacterium]|nr:molybdenum cofactor carrier protein [Alphaproteobacteria bacterium]
MIDRRPIVGVMGSHEKEWEEFSVPVGKLIADHDYHLLTGAGAGVMTSVAKSFTDVEDRAGLSIGVVPTVDYDGNLVPREKYPNPYIEIPILTPLDIKAQKAAMPFSRNFVNVMTSHALVILPGEHGTRDEASLGIQFKKPMILFGPEKSFERFPEQATRVEDIDEVREFLEKVTAKIRMDSENE